MRNLNKIVVTSVLGLLMGATTAFADSAASCNRVPLTVVNSSNQAVLVRGAEGTMIVPANSSTQVAFQSNHFYSKCVLIEVGMKDQTFAKGLIADSATTVHINIKPDGNVEEFGLTSPGFKLDDYVSWWGLGAVLG